MKILLFISGLFFINSIIPKELSFIKKDDPELLKIKNFILENKDRYNKQTLYDVTKEIKLDIEDNDLEVYFFKIDDEILVPFITTNFNRFVHKDLMLKITKFLYKYIISDVEILPISKNNSSNMKLFSYPNEKEVLIIVPLISVRFK